MDQKSAAVSGSGVCAARKTGSLWRTRARRFTRAVWSSVILNKRGGARSLYLKLLLHGGGLVLRVPEFQGARRGVKLRHRQLRLPELVVLQQSLVDQDVLGLQGGT
ncbi:hypothetical protein EYF80_040972 [Liparis tanakae]|uniref:Uncharacterized protein n=1 Tax=Liparis tanakae TaxID=230148 RepID=A0A4Z2G5E0_9TELE|nr:hypothetical protein EYF80_040972 [Liparis tanakae]